MQQQLANAPASGKSRRHCALGGEAPVLCEKNGGVGGTHLQIEHGKRNTQAHAHANIDTTACHTSAKDSHALQSLIDT
jgi:hypothetical protein